MMGDMSPFSEHSGIKREEKGREGKQGWEGEAFHT